MFRSKSMAIDKSKWTDEEISVFAAYDNRCVLCVFMYADTLHHEPPRSLNPRWADEPWTQFPLCHTHHEAVTVMSREEAEAMILHHVDIHFPGALQKVKENALYDIEL